MVELINLAKMAGLMREAEITLTLSRAPGDYIN